MASILSRPQWVKRLQTQVETNHSSVCVITWFTPPVQEIGRWSRPSAISSLFWVTVTPIVARECWPISPSPVTWPPPQSDPYRPCAEIIQMFYIKFGIINITSKNDRSKGASPIVITYMTFSTEVLLVLSYLKVHWLKLKDDFDIVGVLL